MDRQTLPAYTMMFNVDLNCLMRSTLTWVPLSAAVGTGQFAFTAPLLGVHIRCGTHPKGLVSKKWIQTTRH